MESSPEDWEKGRRISKRLKRNLLIKELKNGAIELQLYELATFIRDIEREIKKENPLYLWDDEVSTDPIYDKLQEYLNKINDVDGDWLIPTKIFLTKTLREYKIERILKKPLD